jgi:hypothetical protein
MLDAAVEELVGAGQDESGNEPYQRLEDDVACDMLRVGRAGRTTATDLSHARGSNRAGDLAAVPRVLAFWRSATWSGS